jgi:hypothetical protein
MSVSFFYIYKKSLLLIHLWITSLLLYHIVQKKKKDVTFSELAQIRKIKCTYKSDLYFLFFYKQVCMRI